MLPIAGVRAKVGLAGVGFIGDSLGCFGSSTMQADIIGIVAASEEIVVQIGAGVFWKKSESG